MNLIRHENSYARITREGELIEDSLTFLERQDRREKMYLNYGLVVFAIVICFLVYNIESRREFALNVLRGQIKSNIQHQEPILNIREWMGLGQ